MNETKNRWSARLALRGGLMALGVLALGGLLEGCFGGNSSPGPCGDAQVQASWAITANGAPLSCAQAGASEVDIIVDSMEAPFSCDTHFGTSPLFAPGSHSVTVELRDSSQNVLSRLGPMRESFGCDALLDLGTVELSLTP